MNNSEAKGPPSINSKSTLEARYVHLESSRSPYLDRARECALLTLPSVFPESGTTGTTDFYRPNQSIGARGVNNLANKLLLSVLPPNTPFFKLDADDQTITELAQDEAARAKVEEKFNEIERAVQTWIETRHYRAPLITAFKQLIIGGNSLLLIGKDGRMRVIRLDRYVVRRDNQGKVLELIVKEMTRFEDLPKDVQDQLMESQLPSAQTEGDRKEIALFTVYRLEKGKYVTYQTVQDIEVSGTRGTFPEKDAPFIALRWAHEDGEDYGRSYVEEYIGDLQVAEGLSKAIIDSAAAAAKVVVMVNPAGVTEEDDIANAENLDVVSGAEGDVTMLKLDKQADMAVASSVLNDILQRISYAFLMNTAVQRDAERVTAEEIREMVKELEDALGGTYALFSQEFQLPFVRIIMAKMVAQKRIPDLSGLKAQGIDVEPRITTGVEAIGRGHDLSKLRMFLAEGVVPLGDAGFAELNIADYLKRFGVSLGIDMTGLVKNDAQKQQEAEAAQEAQDDAMTKQAMADMAKGAAPAIAKAATEGGGQPTQ